MRYRNVKTGREFERDQVQCDVCHTDCLSYHDTPTKFGSWANLCEACCRLIGVESRGTRYESVNSSESITINGETFDAWRSRIDDNLIRNFGLGCDDLPDWHYRDAYDQGMSWQDAYRAVVTSDNVW